MAVVDPERDGHLRSRRERRESARGRRAEAPVGQGAGPADPGPLAVPRVVRRIGPRRRLWGLSLTTVVGVELVAATVLLLPAASMPATRVALVALGVIGIGLAIPLRGSSLAGGVVRRTGFVGRATVATVGRRRVPADAPAALVPLQAVFPGLSVHPARDHRGRGFAVLEWAECASAVVAVSGETGPLVHPAGSARLPLAAIYARAVGTGIPLDALAVHTVATGAEAGGSLTHRAVLVTVRVRPLVARAAVAARGGGRAGLDACLAALVSGVEATCRDAGLATDALDVEPAAAAVWSTLEPALAGSPSDAAATWVESWSDVTGPASTHRTAATSTWRPSGDLDALWTGTGVGRTVTTELTPGAGSALARILVRATEGTVRGAAAAAEAVRRDAAAAGIALRSARGEQAAALRATSLLGQGSALPPPRDARAASVLDGRLPLDPALLDRLAPPIGTGLDLGTDDGGTPLSADLVGPRPQRLLVVGQGWVATEVAARAAQAGLPVVVVTDRPAPWTVLARTAGVEGLVHVVTDGRTADQSPLARQALLVVVEGSSTPPATLGRTAWQSTLHVLPRADAVPAALIDTADLVLVAAGAGDDPAAVGADLRVSGDVASRIVQLVGTDVLALSHGIVTPLRLRSGADPSAPAPLNTLVG